MDYGLDVLESREVSPGAADILLEKIASEQAWVLLTQDRDFKANASRRSTTTLRSAAPTVLIRPVQGQIVTWLIAALPIIERHLDLAREERWPLRIIRVKTGVVNVEIAFDYAESRTKP